MTDAELLAYEKIGPEVAAKYLQNGTTAQDIRVEAKAGVSPYCIAKKTPGSSRCSYRINVGLLMQYKAGALGLYGTKDDDYGDEWD